MDIFEGRYFNLNRKLLAFIGHWPYETKGRNVIKVFFMTMLFILPMPQLISVILNYKDVDRAMLNLLAFLNILVMFLKLVGLTIAENKMKGLYTSIANNWLMVHDEKERKILIEYSERGRTVALFYIVSMSLTALALAILPLTSKILDIISPLENPRAPMYVVEGEFFVDREDYFTELFFCDLFLIFWGFSTTIAVDTMYIVASEHCCAMSAIISYRLQSLGKQSLDMSRTYDDSHNRLIQVIRFHQNTLSFVTTMNDSYSLNFLFIMALNLLIIPLDACAIIAHLGDPLALFPYTIFFVAITVHFFFIFWPGQRVLDHNVSICEDAYCNEWYRISLRTKKVYLIFMLRCSEPASLSAGGLFVINYETFSKVMKTAISYITVLASFR